LRSSSSDDNVASSAAGKPGSGGRGTRGPRKGAGIAAKFFLVLALLVPCLVAVAWVGISAQRRAVAEANDLYSHNIVEVRWASLAADQVADAGRVALQLVYDTDAMRRAELHDTLFDEIIPELDVQIADLVPEGHSTREERLAADVSASWLRLKGFFVSPLPAADGSGTVLTSLGRAAFRAADGLSDLGVQEHRSLQTALADIARDGLVRLGAGCCRHIAQHHCHSRTRSPGGSGKRAACPERGSAHS